MAIIFTQEKALMSDAIALKYVEAAHIAVFKMAAKHFKVWILVRSINSAARRFIGRSGYQPKRLDCKAKTAKFDIPPYELAGLVVSPEIHPSAYSNLVDAMRYWDLFRPLVYDPFAEGQRPYLPAGKLYIIERDAQHQHYGAVAFTLFGLSTKRLYVFGDYDLYGIVAEANPDQNIFIEEERLNMPHARGKELFDVQHFLNNRIGCPMIQHGSQEKFSPHTDEDIVIFWPDGQTVTEVQGKAAIEQLYRDTFKGRKTAR